MTAPDRIWCHPTERQPVPAKDRRKAKWVRGIWKDHDSKASGDVEYVRADLAQPVQVRVKPLVWTTRSGAPTEFGTYIVTCEDHDGVTVWFVLFGGKPLARCGEHRTEEAAKAAAQTDYQARILAAIEPQPDPRDEVIARLVEAAQDMRRAFIPFSDDEFRAIYEIDAALAAAKAVQP